MMAQDPYFPEGNEFQALLEQPGTWQSPPGLQGYSMPPEWAPHRATWLSFPHHKTDFTGKLAAMPWMFAEMARLISQEEDVEVLCRDEREQERAAQVFQKAGVVSERVRYHLIPTNRSWNRDTMPIWVTTQEQDEKKSVAVKFRFDGWARYRDHLLDDAAGIAVAKNFASQRAFPLRHQNQRMVLEGGSIDVDEFGTLMTTESCLLSSKLARFQGSAPQAVEEHLKATLGVRHIVWVPDGIVGDDTSGHIDDFARFAPQGRLLICQESRREDENYLPLKAAHQALSNAVSARGEKFELVELPMPEAVYFDGLRLPASYANFYICNYGVLVPVFNDPMDREALSIIADCFPQRRVVGVYARDLVLGLGTLHCSTMQEPAV
ncbi:MAG: agmatine deiminase family protein [Polyangiaceae bacterium]|nr:agmatine deiminase family protein [Polyangiaceae bacterium]